MTVRIYLHSIAKRAKTIALVDSGATKNFMNLSYAKWLRLPIKQLPQARKLYNVDGPKNKSGDLQFYTDLQVQNGGQTHSLRFFLSDLGEHKAILGYPWFAAVQPKIDEKEVGLTTPNSRLYFEVTTQKEPSSSLEPETSQD
jgi:hypothetical protein